MDLGVLPGRLPAQLRPLATRVVETAEADPRILGVLAGGSVAAGTADEYSDLDLVLVCTDESHAEVLAGARGFAEALGPLLTAFTGEHVGEPRLLIALYGPPLVHVDLKFVAVRDAADRVEDGVVLWQREGAVDAALAGTTARWPRPEPQWVEDRFWAWVHYVAVKIQRGELLEAVDGLASLRGLALAPLATAGRTERPSGVRRLETLAPEHAAAFAATVAAPTAADCTRALRAAVDLYRTLRPLDGVQRRAEAEAAVVAHLDTLG